MAVEGAGGKKLDFRQPQTRNKKVWGLTKKQKIILGQRLGVTPKSWLTPKTGCSFGILLFLMVFLHESYVSFSCT